MHRMKNVFIYFNPYKVWGLQDYKITRLQKLFSDKLFYYNEKTKVKRKKKLITTTHHENIK